MSWSLVASTSAHATGNVTTSAINTVGANLIVVAVSSFNNTLPSLSDSAGNTWNEPLTPTSGLGATVGVWYVANPTTSSSHTFTVTGNFPAVAVLAYSGAASSPLDVSNSALNANQPGSITPTANGDLLICGAGLISAASTFSVNDSFVNQEFVDYSSGNNFGLGVATLIQATAAAINPTITLGSGTPEEAFIISFLVAPGSVGTINGQAVANALSGSIGSIVGAATVLGVSTQPTSVGFINGFSAVSGIALPSGVFAFPTSNKDPSIMMTLGFTPSQTLLYDYGNSENFFVLVQGGSPWSSGFSSGFGPILKTLYAVSPFFASQWFGSANGGPPLRTVWNPFPLATSKLSRLVQP